MDENEEEESIVDYIKKVGKNDDIKSINEFIKDNVWIVPIMYIIGNICLLARNRLYNLPFGTLSITQLSVIFTYVVIIYCIFCMTTSIIISIKKQFKRYKTNNNIKYIIFLIFISIIVYILLLILIYYFVQNFEISIIYSIMFFALLNVHEFCVKRYGILYDLIILFAFCIIIIEIPISRGGFKGQKVIFHDSSTNQEKEYTYYGTNENLYQFTDGENVYLIPTENGYIKYKYIN